MSVLAVPMAVVLYFGDALAKGIFQQPQEVADVSLQLQGKTALRSFCEEQTAAVHSFRLWLPKAEHNKAATLLLLRFQSERSARVNNIPMLKYCI